MAVILLDTNVLVYAHDSGDPAKKAWAIEVLDRLHVTGTGRLTTQCLGEFFTIAIRPRQPLLSSAHAAAQVDLLLQA